MIKKVLLALGFALISGVGCDADMDKFCQNESVFCYGHDFSRIIDESYKIQLGKPCGGEHYESGGQCFRFFDNIRSGPSGLSAEYEDLSKFDPILEKYHVRSLSLRVGRHFSKLETTKSSSVTEIVYQGDTYAKWTTRGYIENSWQDVECSTRAYAPDIPWNNSDTIPSNDLTSGKAVFTRITSSISPRQENPPGFIMQNCSLHSHNISIGATTTYMSPGPNTDADAETEMEAVVCSTSSSFRPFYDVRINSYFGTASTLEFGTQAEQDQSLLCWEDSSPPDFCDDFSDITWVEQSGTMVYELWAESLDEPGDGPIFHITKVGQPEGFVGHYLLIKEKTTLIKGITATIHDDSTGQGSTETLHYNPCTQTVAISAEMNKKVTFEVTYVEDESGTDKTVQVKPPFE